ncbi:hypothetical protein DL93DRAFT_97507 [Clavulina sp. PMI_390]|nr:hypothetical protein DL93DRAFT_97507 [Clavulina sp. PMI_390]
MAWLLWRSCLCSEESFKILSLALSYTFSTSSVAAVRTLRQVRWSTGMHSRDSHSHSCTHRVITAAQTALFSSIMTPSRQ